MRHFFHQISKISFLLVICCVHVHAQIAYHHATGSSTTVTNQDEKQRSLKQVLLEFQKLYEVDIFFNDEVIDIHGNSIFSEVGLKIYKARWLLPNSFSYPEDDAMKQCE